MQYFSLSEIALLHILKPRTTLLIMLWLSNTHAIDSDKPTTQEMKALKLLGEGLPYSLMQLISIKTYP
jgi:hypothetical protein